MVRTKESRHPAQGVSVPVITVTHPSVKHKLNLPPEYLRKIGKEEINSLPQAQYDGEILLVCETAGLGPALARLEGERVLGFDTETRPSFNKGTAHPPALLQLAGADLVILIQLALAPFNDALAALLADADIVKAGVAVRDDIKGLQRLLPFMPAGFIDLSECARGAGLETFGLRPLAANFLGFRISKNAQCSNWGNPNLNAQQIRYAATDAWISREICLRMRSLGVDLRGL
jgi:ribonuclease D